MAGIGIPPESLTRSSSLAAPPAAGAAAIAGAAATSPAATGAAAGPKKLRRAAEPPSSHKRRCISTACIACRKRKSKCDGALPSCAACASVYGTSCIYDPNTDHRRKGVYRERADSVAKARASTLQILVEAILNASDDDVPAIVSQIRACDSLDNVAQQLAARAALDADSSRVAPTPPLVDPSDDGYASVGPLAVEGEQELARRMGELRLENGFVRFIGGTSHLIYLGDPADDDPALEAAAQLDQYPPSDGPVVSWTRVTSDANLVSHLIAMYFNYHYAYFTTLSKKLFWRDFFKGRAGVGRATTAHCSPLLVNAMLALGCHFSDVAGAYATPGDSRTKGDHFFAEAKRLILANDEFAKPRLVTVQALALMSVREAGCAREAKGWVYSGMSFRMAQDLGLNLVVSGATRQLMSDDEIDARKMTFWGCFLFDNCWSNYLGRLPQLSGSSSNVSKFDVFPDEDATIWTPLTDKGHDTANGQPCRTRAAARQLSSLSEISSDLLIFFYHPNHIGRSRGKSAELKQLSEIHQRLEQWRRQLPKEFEPREGQLPNVILMHMFFHLQYIHLFRPFLKYNPSTSPLPAHVSPRKICTANAGNISKLMRLYKKTYGLRQICNIAVYMSHSACAIHLLNLPDKSARRDIMHGVKHLEEMAEDWLCARRTLSILSVLARKWGCELPEDAAAVLKRTDEKYGFFSTSDVPSPDSSSHVPSDDDGGPAPASQREHDALGHAAHGHATRFVLPAASLDGQMSMMAAPLHMATNLGDGVRLLQQPQPQPQPQHGLPFESGRMDLSPDVLGDWTSQPGPPSTLISVAGHGMAAEDGAHPGARQVPPSINGQHWILNDSARWYYNFEGWDMGGNLLTNRSVSQGPTDANKQAPTELDDLTASLNGGGWLPGLD